MSEKNLVIGSSSNRYAIYWAPDRKPEDNTMLVYDRIENIETFDFKSGQPYKVEFLGANCNPGFMDLTDE